MGELDLDEAKALALAFFNSSYSLNDDELVILDDETITKGYGWYFTSASRKFLESRDFRDQILGNGPILVTKKLGNIIQFGTAFSLEEYIELYESRSLPN